MGEQWPALQEKSFDCKRSCTGPATCKIEDRSDGAVGDAAPLELGALEGGALLEEERDSTVVNVHVV